MQTYTFGYGKEKTAGVTLYQKLKTSPSMKTVIGILSALLPIIAVAQNEIPDSTVTQELNEVVIQAPKVIRKADMDVYHPSKSAVDNSKDATL